MNTSRAILGKPSKSINNLGKTYISKINSAGPQDDQIGLNTGVLALYLWHKYNTLCGGGAHQDHAGHDDVVQLYTGSGDVGHDDGDDTEKCGVVHTHPDLLGVV